MKLTCSITILFAVILVFSGCSSQQHDYKTESDKAVNRIIDQKWDDSFGSRANYKISDTEPLPDDIQIANTIPPSGILTLPQAVAMATAHNRQYQSEREILYSMALDLKLARHEFETSIFGLGRSRYVYDNGGSEAETKANLGFQRLLTTGARISARITSAWLTMLTGDIRTGLSSILRAEIVQPLLRGSEREIIMENLTQAEHDTLYQVRLFNRFRKTFVVSIISQYYRILQNFDMLENAKDNYLSLSRLHERMEKLSKVGRIEQYELEEAYQDRLGALDVYLKAKKEYEQAIDEFKINLALPTTTELRLDENELASLNLPQESELGFSEEEAIKAGLQCRLDLANSVDAIIDAERKIRVAADSFKPGLDFVVDTKASVLGVGKTSPSQEKRIRGGVELDLNIDKEVEKNTYRKALITLNQQKRQLQEARDWVTLEVRRAYRDLTEAAELYQGQSRALKLAQKRSDNTFELLHYQRASTRDVLDAQKDLFKVKDAATAAMVDYTIATLNFYRDAGVLQVRPDGMWQRGQDIAKGPTPGDSPITQTSIISESEEIQVGSEEFIKQWINKTEPADQGQPKQPESAQKPVPKIIDGNIETAIQPSKDEAIDAAEYIKQWMKTSKEK